MKAKKKLSCELTHYLITTAKETAAEGPRFPDNYQDQEGSRGGGGVVGGNGIDDSSDNGNGGDDGDGGNGAAAREKLT